MKKKKKTRNDQKREKSLSNTKIREYLLLLLLFIYLFTERWGFDISFDLLINWIKRNSIIRRNLRQFHNLIYKLYSLYFHIHVKKI